MQRPASARSDPTSYFLSPADPRLPSQEHSASAHVVLKQLSSLASLLQELAIFIILFLTPFYIRLENMDKAYRHRTARHTLQLISMRSEQTQEHNIFSGKALFAKVLNPIATIQSYSSITFQTITYHSPSFTSCPPPSLSPSFRNDKSSQSTHEPAPAINLSNRETWLPSNTPLQTPLFP